jgi:hypothetical protein
MLRYTIDLDYLLTWNFGGGSGGSGSGDDDGGLWLCR